MAKYGEWNRKGATLSDITAKKEYDVDRQFIIKGINTGKLEYRQGAIWGNPYLKILRSQLEEYIASELGPEYLAERQEQIRVEENQEGDIRYREKTESASDSKN